MNPKNEMRVFFDKNGTPIKAGDILYREFKARWRERPGGRRVTINCYSGEESIVNDEGSLLESDGKKHWVTMLVEWRGACLVAERVGVSDFQVIMNTELFDDNGHKVYVCPAFHYLDNGFDSTVYEIKKNKGEVT